ncbi:MAG: type II toxin-antitoxin system VapC family toxin [Solirubrobacteraceae bacterium]
MSTATPAPGSNVVLDASAVLRALVEQQEEAVAWLRAAESGDVQARSPELVFVEVAHGLLRLVRAGRLDELAAVRGAARLLAGRLRVEPLAPLALPALHVARERRITVYDACYAVLAERLAATLVTADRRLADATPNAVLLAED